MKLNRITACQDGVVAGLCLLGFSVSLAASQEMTREAALEPAALTELSLTELTSLEVTSVSRKEEPIFQASSAVAIVTAEQIRRSGVTTIPDALRLVPGVQVARVSAHDWAVSARGFNDLFANKLLVLVDGRSVYTPLFSGVFWDVQDTLLADIERIEVIRGPGATLWGANAVNGVINIITRSARDTQGLRLSGGSGSEELGFGNVRYGGAFSEQTHYRVYTKYFNRDDSVLPSGADANDAWWMARTGFRVDHEPHWGNTVTVQGDYYYGELDQTYLLPSLTAPNPHSARDVTYVGGGNLLSRWTHRFSEASDLQVQLYYDRVARNSSLIDQTRHTADLDLQHRFPLLERHEVIWGLGYRFTHDHQSRDTFALSIDPDHRDSDLYSGFLQTEWELVEERLGLTLGSKLERNDYTGGEVQPGARLVWTPNDHQTFWGSVSRAVRTPSRIEDDGRLVRSVNPGLVPSAVTLFGDHGFESEELIAYELGYRVLPRPELSVDLATFYNDYEQLRSFRAGPSFASANPPPPHLVVPLTVDNQLEGETYGVELSLDYRPLDWWHWRASYTYLEMQLHLPAGSGDLISEQAESANPHHQVTVQTSLDLPLNLRWDLVLRYVDHLPALSVPSYVAFDSRLAWRPRPNLEISLIGQNLFDDQHPEFVSTLIRLPPTEVERAVYGRITLEF